jgi:hypothetical protein
MVHSPIGPAPHTATVSPTSTRASFTEWRVMARGSARVPTSVETPSGSGSTLEIGRLTRSRKKPGFPGVLRKRMLAQMLCRPEWQNSQW